MKIEEVLKNIPLILLGNLLLAFSVYSFILPNDILTGGLAGIAVLCKPFIPIDEETLITIMTVFLFIIGWLLLGHEFALTTFVSTLAYPLFLAIFRIYGPVFELESILAALYGGLLGGIGVGLVMRCGASTGGMDIPPLVLRKYFGFDLSKTVLITDGLTVLFGLLIYGIEPVLMGLISVYTTAIAISKILTFGGSDALSCQIISEKDKEIAGAIQVALGRGITVLYGEGGYTKERKQVILVVIGQRQYQRLMQTIEDIDPTAFVIVSEAKEIHGNGFSYNSRI